MKIDVFEKTQNNNRQEMSKNYEKKSNAIQRHLTLDPYPRQHWSYIVYTMSATMHGLDARWARHLRFEIFPPHANTINQTKIKP